MKYIKTFEIKKQFNYYDIFYNFLEEIKSDIRFILVNDYSTNEKREKGLAFSFGSKVLIIFKFVRNQRQDKIFINRITINKCPLYSVPDKLTDFGIIAKEIVDYIEEILMKITEGSRNSSSCEFFYYLKDDDINELQKNLTKENFDLYKSMKKFNL